MNKEKKKQENNLEISHELTETSRLIDLDTLDTYEANVRKTVLLYYGDNKFETQKDLAEHLQVSRETVSNRLNSDEARQFMKMFSHRDKDELDRWFEELAAKHYNKAMQAIKLAIKKSAERDDVSPQILKSAGMSLLKADEQFAKNLQEFGAIQKPKERKEIQDSTGQGDDLMKRMQEAQKQLSEANSSENQEKKDKEKVEA